MSNEAMVNNLTNILNGLDDSQEKLEKDGSRDVSVKF